MLPPDWTGTQVRLSVCVFVCERVYVQVCVMCMYMSDCVRVNVLSTEIIIIIIYTNLFRAKKQHAQAVRVIIYSGCSGWNSREI